MTLDSLRRNIGIIPQDIVLFNDTLRYNICYGDFNATQERVDDVIRKASLDPVISRLSNGVETLVGERGLKVSGGEKQRIAIARAMLKNPPLMLCDEPTSALDTVTESDVMGHLTASVSSDGIKRTTVVVAHRLSVIQSADLIVVLDDGRVVEQGTHEDLLGLAGKYSELVRQLQH